MLTSFDWTTISSFINRGGDKTGDDFALPKTTQQVAKQPFRTTTPPPNARQRRTSTPPGEIPLVRTSSRHSKSASDGSFGTPAPSSPPSYAKSHLKPPPRAVSQYSKAKTKTSPVKDISEPVYKNFWMCGFTDAFKFDGFKEWSQSLCSSSRQTLLKLLLFWTSHKIKMWT